MSESSDAVALRSVTGVLKRRWKMLAFMGLLGASLAGTIGFLVPPRYTAKAQIVVEPPVGNIVGTLDEAAIETRVELLLSDSHLQRVLESLHRDGHSLVTPPVSVFGFASNGEDGEINESSEIRILHKNVNAFKERKSRVIGVTYTAADPALAAEVANRSVTVYFETLRQNGEIGREEKLRMLNAQLPRARAEAERAEGALQSYRAEAGLMESKGASLAQEEIADLTRLLSLARSELLQRQEKMKLLRSFALAGASDRDVSDALQQPIFAEVMRESARELLTLRDMSSNRGDRAELVAQLGAAVEQHLAKISDEATRFSARVRTLQQRLETFKQAGEEARAAEVRLRELERESSVASQLLQSLLQQLVELRSSSPEPLDVRVASPATAPEFPSSPDPILFIPPAMAVALIFAGLVAVIRERLDDKVWSQNGFTESLRIPCAGLMPKLSKKSARRAHLNLQKAPFSPFSEAMRTIALSVLSRTNPSRGPIILAVTSSVQGEGKTTLARNLAYYLTLIEKRVLVVDLDFRSPSFGIAESGVLDALMGHSVRDVIIQIPDTCVDFLPMQVFRGDPLASLEVENFSDQIRAVGAGYNFVVLDLGPLLGASETALFCQAADLNLFAVTWGSTREDVAWHALQLIEPSKALGILTKVNLRQHAKFRFGDIGETLSQRPQRAFLKT